MDSSHNLPLLALIGPKGAGKSTTTNILHTLIPGSHVLSTSDVIRGRYMDEPDLDDLDLAALGQILDRDGPNWLVAAALDIVAKLQPTLLVVDAVRTGDQLDALGREFRVLPVWVDCQDTAELLGRLRGRGLDDAQVTQMRSDPVEAGIATLLTRCSVHLNTSGLDPEALQTRLVAHLQPMIGRCAAPRYQTHVVIGGQWGSEGKGNVVAWYARRNPYSWLVRSGGPNAGHTVYYEFDDPTLDERNAGPASDLVPEGCVRVLDDVQQTGITQVNDDSVSVGFTTRAKLRAKQVFHHLPSATLHRPSAGIVLAPGAVIRVSTLIREIEQCEKLGVSVWNRLHVSPDAFVITDHDIALEGSIVEGIGSTGQGVGMAVQRRVSREHGRMSDMSHWIGQQWDSDPPDWLVKLNNAVARYQVAVSSGPWETPKYSGLVLLEGTQGFGLSLYHGEYPYCTSRDTGVAGLLSEAGLRWDTIVKVTAVFRTHPIRVESPSDGTSGGMRGEISWADVASESGYDTTTLQRNETTTTTKRQRRVARFDWDQTYRTCQMNGVTHVVLTFADYHDKANREATNIDELNQRTRDMAQRLWVHTGCVVDGVSVGPLTDHVIQIHGVTR